jgi:hypothetical protein
MRLMNDETLLREKARNAIQAGQLPDREPSRTWAGKGGGGTCSVCTDEVQPQEIEFELEFQSGKGQPDGLANYRFHMRCFAAWEFERQSRSSNGRHVDGRGPA